MYRLLETIRIAEGLPDNLTEHEARVTRSQEALFGSRSLPPLYELFSRLEVPKSGIHKWRIIYDQEVRFMEILPHEKPAIHTLQLIHLPDAAYGHKYEDRSFLNALRSHLDKGVEPIMVVDKRITDTSISNLVFFDGKQWLTPSQPVLLGTRRAQLLKAGTIDVANISVYDLDRYERVRLINALLPWHDCIELNVSAIIKQAVPNEKET